MKSRALFWIFAFALGIAAAVAGGRSPAAQETVGQETVARDTGAPEPVPYPDAELERRLELQRTYTSKPGDTLRYLARLMYGHDNWWPKLRKQNDGLVGYGPDERLPAGTRVQYRAPRIGDEYTVQKGDWLIRIALWKYGESELWEDLFRQNAARISNPNLIYPGDQLTLTLDGTVRNLTTGKVLMSPEQIPKAPRTREIGVDDPREPARRPAAQEPPDPFWDWVKSTSPFVLGALAGLLLLLLMPLWWLIQKKRATETFWDRVPASYEGSPEAQARRDSAPANRARERDADEDEYEEEWEDIPVPPQGNFQFKKRPKEEIYFDKSLIRYEDGEVSQPLGYHAIVPKKLKKYLIRKRKRAA